MAAENAIPLAGNAPLALTEPGAAWRVEAGRAELFAVAGGGPRLHLASAGEGEPLLAVAPLALEGGELRLVAVGQPGTRLAPASHPAAGAPSADDLAALGGWVDLLTRRLPAGGGPRRFRELRPGEEVELGGEGAGEAARHPTAPLWLEVMAGSVLFCGRQGLALVAGDGPFPLPARAWCTVDPAAGEEGVRLRCLSGEEMVGRDGARRGLERFHRLFLRYLALEMEGAEAGERRRLERRADLDRRALAGAHARLAAVLEPAAAPSAPEPGLELAAAGARAGVEAAGDALLAACRLVGEARGIAVVPPPETRRAVRPGEELARVAAASRFRSRRVLLRGDWWRRDNGPLVGFHPGSEGEGRRPVALLPISTASYEVVDPAAGHRAPVDAETAAELEGEAYMFYPPLPERPVGVADLLRAALRGRGRDVATIALMGAGGGLLAVLVPIFTGILFGHVIPRADRSQLAQLAAALAVAALAAAAFQITRAIAVLRISGKMDGSLQAAVWDRLLALPVDFFRRFTVGDLANRSLGIDAIRDLLTGNVLTSVLGGAFSVFSFALLFYYSWRLALLATALVAVLAAVTTLATYLQLRHQRALLELAGKLESLLFGFIHGIAKLRVAGAEGRAYARWAAGFAEQRRRAIQARRVAIAQGAFNAAYGVLTTLGIFAVVGMAAAVDLSVGDFLAFNAAFGQFLAATLSLVGAFSGVLALVPIYERLSPILEAVPEVDGSKAEPGDLGGEVEFSHVSFRYGDDGPPVLDDVSFRAGAGEFIALVGPSGSGKSTCLRLLLGFEKPLAGSIYYGGQDLAHLSLHSVRRQIGVVLQSSRLMAGSIFTNIASGANLSMEEAWEAARLAGLAQDIQAMPMGMHTVVSEGASTFSGGQKQRLLIARAIVQKPRVLFLDEATSALDNRTQEVVSRSLERLKATRVVIAHRLSTIRGADRIYVLDKGRLVEEGSYEELAGRGGAFARLIERQTA